MDTCTICGSHLGGPWGNRCYKCKPGRPRSGEDRPCAQCGETFHAPAWAIKDEARNSGIYCSKTCKYAAMRGRELVKGTTYIQRGYRWVKVGIRQYKLEHRLVVEAAIGRKLDRLEEVHHINGDKLDNRLENLKVVDPVAHQAIHKDAFAAKMRRRITLTCEHCGATFERRPKLEGQRFCSRSCRSKVTSGFSTGKARRFGT